jgi:hypothetical protein
VHHLGEGAGVIQLAAQGSGQVLRGRMLPGERCVGVLLVSVENEGKERRSVVLEHAPL